MVVFTDDDVCFWAEKIDARSMHPDRYRLGYSKETYTFCVNLVGLLDSFKVTKDEVY